MIRKAQGMGINVVIIAAIALLILVIIALLVSGAFRSLGEGTASCQSKGGVCTLPQDASVGSEVGEYTRQIQYDGEEGCTCYIYNYG